MNKKIAVLSMLLSLSIVIAIIESFIPVFIPGVKLGLANIIILVVLYLYGPKETFLMLILRILTVALLRTGFGQNFYISLSGGIISYIFMILAFKSKLFSVIGVSIMSSYFHIVGQFIFLIIFYQLPQLLYYFGIVLIISFISGTITGIIAMTILNRLKHIFKEKKYG